MSNEEIEYLINLNVDQATETLKYTILILLDLEIEN